MSKKPNLAKDMDELTERTDEHLLRLLDHARRDGGDKQCGEVSKDMQEQKNTEGAVEEVGESERPLSLAPKQSSRNRKKAPAEAVEPADVQKTLTTQLPTSTIKRLKRATSHQHLNDVEPAMIQGIVHQAIEEWCDKRNYT